MHFLLLHGWQGSGPDHWQTWLAGRLREDGHDVAYPVLPDPDRPRLDAWLGALEPLREPDQVVICHSLGCCLWLHHRARGGAPAIRVALVAPPRPDPMPDELAEFFPVPADPGLGRGARVFCSDDDPYCPAGAQSVYATALGTPVAVLEGAGHINADAGFGPWPHIEDWAYGAKKGVET